MAGARIRYKVSPKTFLLFSLVASKSRRLHSAVAHRCAAANTAVSLTFNVSLDIIAFKVLSSMSTKSSASRANSACASMTCQTRYNSYSKGYSVHFIVRYFVPNHSGNVHVTFTSCSGTIRRLLMHHEINVDGIFVQNGFAFHFYVVFFNRMALFDGTNH